MVGVHLPMQGCTSWGACWEDESRVLWLGAARSPSGQSAACLVSACTCLTRARSCCAIQTHLLDQPVHIQSEAKLLRWTPKKKDATFARCTIEWQRCTHAAASTGKPLAHYLRTLGQALRTLMVPLSLSVDTLPVLSGCKAPPA